MEIFPRIKQHVLHTLKTGLSQNLTYHNLGHTLDVLEQACVIAEHENITNPDDLLLLQVSALYHDVGFLKIYSGHEEKSCAIATADLTYFGFNPDQINRVNGMINATKVPQSPLTKLEEIICDADLDYLGRDDFYRIAAGLYLEFLEQGIVKNEQDWDLLQIRFLESHRYFTKSSLQRRQAKKLAHLQAIKERVGLFH
ncbi:HD domain-containing protein [Adhaeribacter rhizoryzae]|uniref:HD domain-containing protein n=1 Tax=Adhaeribacter rhizoryzae TaxID=2607907 RepID=A0A5M6D7W3_9BACT|nr:HD domain-containing protein [Adhaeribacter rhizoryzae]KAA5541265.1 HD domain-containing protein [Adhaeribacter rhizoryzae]